MQKISILLLVLLGGLLAWVIPDQTVSAGSEDFVKYWAASKLVVEGKNPYDTAAIAQVCTESWPGCFLTGEDVIVTWNPPWLLVFLVPLTFLPYMAAVRLWIVLSLALLILSVCLLWLMLGGQKDIRGFILALIVVFLHGSTIHLLRMGQITSLLLACLVLFVWLVQRRWDWLAGLMVLVLTVKFQMFYLILLIMFFWMLRERRWGLAVGGLVGAFAAMMVAWLLYPGWFSEYIRNVSQLSFNFLYTSTLGSFAYWVFGQAWVFWLFLLLLPLAWPLSGRVKTLGWLVVLNLAIAVSVPLAPYGYSFDHVIFIPLITQLVFWLRDDRLNPPWRLGLLAGIVITWVTIFWFMSIPSLPYYWLALPALALSGIYLAVALKIGNLFSKQLAR